MTTVLVLCILLCAASAAASGFTDLEEKGAPAARHICPRDWFSFGSHCFKVVKNPVSWIRAEEHCNSLGAHLASVSNHQEYAFLQQITRMAGLSSAWLGGFNLQGRWMWIDREGFYYSYWHCLFSPHSNPCIYLATNSGWINTPCGLSLPFICSRNPFGC
uniref:ladderlectin-like n=1 Tax=Semicossyphus pulcher TaxID=241346 RepID=UPI0037E715A6